MLTAAGLLFAADVNRTADAAGESCADVMAKVELWFESVRNGTTDEQIEIKRRANELVGSVCLLKKAGAANITTIKKPTTGWIEKSPDPRCQAAQDEIRAWSLANANPSRAELIEFKERANRLLEAACIESPAKRSP